jgi:hypothetical protein
MSTGERAVGGPIKAGQRVRVNPNGFFYMFRWWPHPLKYDGEVFAYSWLGFWWSVELLARTRKG